MASAISGLFSFCDFFVLLVSALTLHALWVVFVRQSIVYAVVRGGGRIMSCERVIWIFVGLGWTSLNVAKLWMGVIALVKLNDAVPISAAPVTGGICEFEVTSSSLTWKRSVSDEQVHSLSLTQSPSDCFTSVYYCTCCQEFFLF